jgi:uncharacterized protein YdeI (YjbR/CyaY-like superfamily)
VGAKDPRIDAYIDRSAGFARPILRHLRRVVHAACPGVEETMKWSFPHFMYRGMLCSMASFKAHCAFGFWKERLLADVIEAAAGAGAPAMGQFGRITSIEDLPDETILARLVEKAAALNESGVRTPARAKPKGDRRLEVPDYFLGALRRNRKAMTTFEGFSFSNRRDYVEWVTGAKRDGTRRRRLETAVAWLAEGKVRNWKYVKS